MTITGTKATAPAHHLPGILSCTPHSRPSLSIGLQRPRKQKPVPGIAQTVAPFAIKQHYYASSKMLKPTGIVGLGPDIAFAEPSTRATKPGSR